MQFAHEGPPVLGLRAHAVASVQFSRSQSRTAAHVVRWAVLNERPREGRVFFFVKKITEGVDILQQMVDKASNLSLCRRSCVLPPRHP